VEFDADETGVRQAAQAKAQELLPEVTRGQMVSGTAIAEVVGGAPSFRPANFGELLDATLSL
jgi:hypothetical protein